MSRDYTVVCLSEVTSPLTHAQGSSGNQSLIVRSPVVTPKGVAWPAAISGNALRHRAVRAVGWRWLIGEYGLHGRLNLMALNFMMHGGSLTEGGGRENTRRIADFQRLFPLGRLLGGCLPDQVLGGSLHVWRGTLVCEENRPTLTAMLGELVPDVRLRPAESFVSGYQYVRGEARKTARDLCPADAADGPETNQMIFAGQSVLAGAQFVHGFTLPHCSEAELGALLWSLRLWQAAGGTVGGQAARGHGRLRSSLLASADWDADAAVACYLERARSSRDEAVAWLESVFGPLGGSVQPPATPSANGGGRRRKGATA